MIASLKGVVLEKSEGELVIDVQGVGYRVSVSALTLGRLPREGEAVQVRVRTVVREDAFELFGFRTAEEESLFLLLTSVSHVGPRLALTVMSGLDVDELAEAIERGEVARLTRVHGVGKKTAERLVLELRDKVRALPRETPARPAVGSAARDDLVSALVNLGYRPAQATSAADGAVERLGVEAALEPLLREALKGLRTG